MKSDFLMLLTALALLAAASASPAVISPAKAGPQGTVCPNGDCK